jgi:O-antigen/teichoic acid export membrane protein
MVLEHVAAPAGTALLVVAFHAWRPADTTVPVIAVAVAQGACAVVAWAAARHRIAEVRDSGVFRPLEWMRFSVPVWLEQWMFFLVATSGYVFVARFDDLQAVGVYASAVRVAALVGLPLVAVSAILGPTISNLAGRGEWERLGELYGRTTRVLTVVGIVAAVGLTVVGKPVLGSFGHQFRAAWATLAILLAGQAVNCATGPSGLMLTMTGRTVRRLANVTAGGAIAVGLSFVLVPRWGTVGAATAGVVASSLVNGVQVRQVRRLLATGVGRPAASPARSPTGTGAGR